MAESRTAKFINGFEVFVTHDKKHFDSDIYRIDECAVYDYMDCIVSARVTYFESGESTNNVLYSDMYDDYGTDDIIVMDNIIAEFMMNGFVR